MSGRQEVVREKQVNIRFADDELERLEQLAKHFSLSPGSLVRMLIKEKYDELFPPAPEPKQAKKR
jgi:hypothetical protein